MLAVDEAHKFMDGGSDGGDGLSRAIVNCARLMRHDGLRVLVSTQSPQALAPELLELVSVCALHRFHSRDWYTYLDKKLRLPADGFDIVSTLPPGHALLFASRASLGRETSLLRLRKDADTVGTHAISAGTASFRVRVRQRLTADRGATRLHRPLASGSNKADVSAKITAEGVAVPVASTAADGPSYFDNRI